METVNVQCGHCHKLMAVSKDHLGQQVHCPHCQGVVQAPPAVPEIKVPTGDSADIFSTPEGSSDDIFGLPRQSRLELPDPSPPASSAEQDAPTVMESNAAVSPAPAVDLERTATEPAPDWREPGPTAPESQEISAIAPQRYTAKRSLLGPMLLIFLIPYSLVTTGIIAFLLLNRPKPVDPFERLPDPNPKEDGAPQRVKHNARLPDHLKTPLLKAIQVGDLEVTPLQVAVDKGDLVLHLKMRNLSKDLAFNPLPFSFVNNALYKKNKPYTFLDAGEAYLYGGDVFWFKGGERVLDGKFSPGEELVTQLRTHEMYQRAVAALRQANKPLLWRVQVRRGLVETSQGLKSATAVIGVEFPASAIKEGA